MALSLNKQKLGNLASEIWKSAERLRGKFKAYEYQNVILPIIVIRRLECVLIKWREDKKVEIKAKRPKDSDKDLEKLVKELELNLKQTPFSNKTKWTLRKIYEEDHSLLEKHFRDYIKGFSDNVQEIIDNFDYRAVIGRMVKNSRLAPILNQYSTLEVGQHSQPDIDQLVYSLYGLTREEIAIIEDSQRERMATLAASASALEHER